MKKLMYILFFLMSVFNLAAQENYVIDSVCVVVSRSYQIIGEKGSTYEWYVYDTLGNVVLKPIHTDFWVEKSPGDTTWSSKIKVPWNDTGEFDIVTLHFSEHGCDTLEQGRVKVFPDPQADAGKDMIVCITDPIVLASATASGYSSLLWTTIGDGAFDDNSKLNPVYTPGAGEIIAGSATLVLQVNGRAENVTCIPVIDTLEILFGNPLIKFNTHNLLCYNDSTGSIKVVVTGGIGPFVFNWTGPGTFTANSDSIFGLTFGKYKVSITDNIGCEVTDSVEITQPDKLIAGITADKNVICFGDSIFPTGKQSGGTLNYTTLWIGNGARYLSAGNIAAPTFKNAPAGLYELIYTVTDSNRCFAADTLLVTVNPVYNNTIPLTICENDLPYDWRGQKISKAGFYTDSLLSINGCDSVLTLDFNIWPVTRDTIPLTVCENELPYNWRGKLVNNVGFISDTLLNINGCDSIEVLVLNTWPVTSDTVSTAVCENDLPYIWQGKSLNKTGFYSDSLLSIHGCDSVLNIQFKVKPAAHDTLQITICENELPYKWRGQELKTPGFYSDFLSASNGCDSVLFLDFDVLPVIKDTLSLTICDSQLPYPWLGHTFAYSDTIIINIPSVTAGCDTLRLLKLQSVPEILVSLDTTICENDLPFTWHGEIFTEADTITQKIASVTTSCDTIRTLQLKVNRLLTDTLQLTVCENDLPYNWRGEVFNTADTIVQNIVSKTTGCDTIRVLQLRVNPLFTDSLQQTICAADLPFNWYGKDYFTTNIYHDTLTGVTGCDTILKLDLKVLPEILDTVRLTVCEGDLPYTWLGKLFTSADTITINIPSGTSGCDTIKTLELQTIPEIYVTEKKTIYESELPYRWFGEIFNKADTLVQILPSTTGGCDTIRTLELITIPGILVTENITICEDELPYLWFGKTFTNADTVVVIVPSTTGGSDTIRTLQLQTLPVKIVGISVVADRTEICSGKPVIFTATTVNGGTSPLYSWYVNGKVVPGETSEIFTYNPRNGDEVYATVMSSLICSKGNPAKAIPVSIKTSQNITPAIAGIGPFCQFSVAPPLPTTTLNGIIGTWSPSKINTNVATNNTYTFTPDTGQCALVVQIDIEVLPVVTPVFAHIGPLCQYSAAPLLPTVSTNGIKGTWNPGNIKTDVAGTNTYTFTPDSGQCAVPTTMTIEIMPEVTPDFVQIGPLCQNTMAPVLPSVSVNGITGTWNPAIIDTKKDGTFTYTFTPSAGKCASQVTMTVIITPEITPEFSAIGPLCVNSAAPLLPLISNNGIKGTWSPAVINTSAAGTNTYLFTPDAGKCVVTFKLNIEITDKIKPVFAAMGPFCKNSTAPSLPLISDNGIHGTWLPDTILTTVTGTFPFSFTPDSGECAIPVTINIDITDKVKPIFAAIGPLCQNTPAPILPAISGNGITGTWNPAIIETFKAGTFIYTFTPSADLCAVPVDVVVEIMPEITPEFSPIGPFCQNSVAPVLPSVSINGITGSWSPNKISTALIGIMPYKFTPDANQCADAIIINVEITDKINPLFNVLGPLCQNSVAPALPAVSTNGIKGTWTPDKILTVNAGVFTFKFTPDPNQCAAEGTMDVKILPEITPVFEALSPVCPNSKAPLLPAISTNGITGTWNPAIIETSKQGVFKFTFTPDSGQCAVTTTLNIEISDKIPPVAICRDFTVFIDFSGKATITTAQINNGSNDNCELDTLYLSKYDFDCTDVGKNPVTLFAVDVAGLRDSCEAVITVIDDEKPQITCKEPFEIQLDENAKYKIAVDEVQENAVYTCGLKTVYVYPNQLDCSHIGLTPIGLWAVGVNGDSAYCESQVTIYGNRAPNIIDDSVSTFENVPVIIEAVLNDYDEKTSIDKSTLAISIKPLHGTVTVNPNNGDLTYTPNLNFSGVDVLQYSICDDGIPCEPECGTAFVYINVLSVNEPPVTSDDFYDTGCLSISKNVLENDIDPDGSDNMQINTVPVKPPGHGTVIIDADGTINYFPNEGFIGKDSLEYVVCDNGIPSLCDTVKVYINVDCNELNPNPLDCELFIPEGFSPDNDGILDFFRIWCIEHYPDAKLMIFNRNGNLLYQKENYGNYDVWGDKYNAWWWGTSVYGKYDIGNQMINGEPKLKVGNYVYVLQLGDGLVKNGTVLVIY